MGSERALAQKDAPRVGAEHKTEQMDAEGEGAKQMHAGAEQRDDEPQNCRSVPRLSPTEFGTGSTDAPASARQHGHTHAEASTIGGSAEQRLRMEAQTSAPLEDEPDADSGAHRLRSAALCRI